MKHQVYSLLTAEEAISTSSSSHLSKTLATTLDDQDDIEEKLETLKEIHNDTSPVAVDAESYVAIVLSRKSTISTCLE